MRVISAVVISLLLIINFFREALTGVPLNEDQEADITFSIRLSQTQVSVGSPTTWHVAIHSDHLDTISKIEFEVGDSLIWAFENSAEQTTFEPVYSFMDLTVIPIVSGNLIPVLQINYWVDQQEFTEVVWGNEVIQVVDPEEQLEFRITTNTGTAKLNDLVEMILWIHNASPLTFSQITISGQGSDLAWENIQIVNSTLAPTQQAKYLLRAKIVGENPEPQVIVEGFLVSAQINKPISFFAVGNPITLEESFWSKISYQVLILLLGVLAGVLTSFMTNFYVEWYSRRNQKKINKKRICGLFRLIIFQANHAAINGVLVDLEPIISIYKDDGLYTIANTENVLGLLSNLWKMAESHNAGLTNPGGIKRSEDLISAAQELSNAISTQC